MAREEQELRGDVEYKCKRCGEAFVKERKTEEFLPVGTNLYGYEEMYELYRTRREKEISRGVTINDQRLPYFAKSYTYHKCSDGGMGIGECVGFRNLKMYIGAL